ncbi:MAG: hypothetical protein U0Y68_14040 [Blastocatellia bacterium]
MLWLGSGLTTQSQNCAVQFVAKWGSLGPGNATFNAPSGVAVGSANAPTATTVDPT